MQSGEESPIEPIKELNAEDRKSMTEDERTWNINIIGEADNRVTEVNEENEVNEQIETEIDINDLEQVNRIYRKYLKDPKEPEVGGEEIDLEILLINSLKKIQEKSRK